MDIFNLLISAHLLIFPAPAIGAEIAQTFPPPGVAGQLVCADEHLIISVVCGNLDECRDNDFLDGLHLDDPCFWEPVH